MYIQAPQHSLSQQDSILTEREISSIKSRLNQNKCSGSDWTFIKSILRNKCLFTARPVDESLSARFTIDGILYDKDALQAFTNLEDCEEYARRYAGVRIGRNCAHVAVPFETVIQTADKHEKNLYIDLRHERDDRFIVYDGKAKTFHLCINQKM